jgi:hypothetical protein
MKTTRNKTAGGGRSTSPAASKLPTRKAIRRTRPTHKRIYLPALGNTRELGPMRRTHTKPPSKNKRMIHSARIEASENPPELGADSYQASACSQTQPRLTSLNPAKVMELIHELSDLRTELAPQVPTSIPTGQRHFVTPEPLWDVSIEVRDDGRVLMIRHPGIGWLGFILPQADCDRLAKKLTGKLK